MQQFPINLDMYVAIVGFFLPVVIAAVNRCGWPSTTKYAASFVVVCVAAVGHLFFAGQWDVGDIPGSILKMLFMTIGSYLIFWRPSGISDRIESRINPGPIPDECKTGGAP
jgi:hypothetical protein